MSFLAQQGLKEIKQQEVDPDKIILKIEKREAEEKALRERERKLIIGGSLLVGTVLVAIIIYLINNKIKPRGQ